MLFILVLPSIVLVQASDTNYHQNRMKNGNILDQNSLSANTSNFSSKNVSLDYSTYLGGSSNDYGYAVAVNSFGDGYITGMTSSSDFPVKNAFQSSYSGGPSVDIYLAKFGPSGHLLFSTYFGGNKDDVASAIAVDKSGDCYITGYTTSSNFPTKNAYNATFGGASEVFLAKFNATGELLFSTYFGGNNGSRASGIALGPSGNIYITGTTYANDFPVLHAYQSTYAGGINWYESYAAGDAFIAEFNSSGQLLYSTYFGGSSLDAGSSIAVDSSGNFYITGYTYSSDFPTKNAYNATFGGGSTVGVASGGDAFVAKFNATGQLDYSTYLGGSGEDRGTGIGVDNAGNCYVTGYTMSNDFPLIQPAVKSVGTGSGFLTKFNATGQPVFSTLMYGVSGTGIAVDRSGNSFITGQSFPSQYVNANPDQIKIGPADGSDAFIAKFDTNGGLVFTLYIGGNSTDFGNAIAIDSNDTVYLVGGTLSSDFPTQNAFISTFVSTKGSGDAFVTKIFINQTPSSPSSTILSEINIFVLLGGLLIIAIVGLSFFIFKK